MKKYSGFTLIELIIFIIIIAIAISILIALAVPLKNMHRLDKQTQAMELAEQRMEIIIGNEQQIGTGAADPCKVSSPPAICNTSNLAGNSLNPTGYIVSSTSIVGDLDNAGWQDNPSGSFTKHEVTVKDSSNNDTLATVSTALAGS